jgi:hypothetical protein
VALVVVKVTVRRLRVMHDRLPTSSACSAKLDIVDLLRSIEPRVQAILFVSSERQLPLFACAVAMRWAQVRRNGTLLGAVHPRAYHRLPVILLYQGDGELRRPQRPRALLPPAQEISLPRATTAPQKLISTMSHVASVIYWMSAH